MEFPEQTLADIEQLFESAKALRMQSKIRWEVAKGRYHGELVARREAGATMTIADMKALTAIAIDDVEYVKAAYLVFISADTEYRKSKVAWEAAKRNYWDSKPIRT